ncbi:MAG TPA: ABC transporter ATP-binding protein [Nevskiaceae bacterium]|nr:ABC transporter ATP-binding protein [Nevskiaceae bacterium]
MNVTRETLRLYVQHACRYPKYLAGIFISVPITVFAYQILPPLIVASVLNRLAKGDYEPHHIWASFGPELVAYSVLMLFGGVVLWRISDYFNWRLEANVQRDMAQRIYSHLLDQSANFHANTFGGSLVSQASKFLGAYIRIVDTTMYSVFPLFLALLFTVIILAPKALLFVLLLVAFSLVYMATSVVVTKPVRKQFARHAAAESDQTGYLADSITNVMAIKTFAAGQFEQRQFAKATNHTRDRLLQVMRGHAKQQAYFSGINNAIAALSFIMAVVSVMVFNADFGTVFLILSYTSNICSQLWVFSSNAIRNYNRALGDAREMTHILGITPEVQDPSRPEKPRISHGAIEFDNTIFTHNGADDALFNGLTLHIEPGEKVGLVGHSGSGKTTLTKLLLRYADIDGGEIRIDGQNIAHITQDDLRAHVAYVPQEPLLFHRSIKENIAYGKPGATDAEIFDAAQKANASEFIDTLPQNYGTLVGERGVKLSGGQRQRIAIARAILKDAPILVLDEATSALDSESELLIQAALQELMKKRTAIVIAHRLSTVQKMDRIIVLEDGAIVEQGSHQQLIKQKGTYAQLWKHQSGGFIDE